MMPRDLEKLPKTAILAELEEKHGIEVSAVTRPVEVPPPEGAPEGAKPTTEERPIPTPERTEEELLKEFGGLLDTTTEEEREQETADRVKAENANAPSEEDVTKLFEAPTVEPVGGPEGDLRVSQWVLGDHGRPVKIERDIVRQRMIMVTDGDTKQVVPSDAIPEGFEPVTDDS